MTVISRRAAAADGAFAAVKDFYFNSRYAKRRADPAIADFTFGNPHEMPLDGIVAAIRERAVPREQGLVRLQDQRGGAAGLSRPSGRPGARPRVRAGGHRPHRRGLRRDLGRVPAGARRRRRGGLLRAGLVLLRTDAARRRCRPAEGPAEAAALRSRPRRDRRGDRAADAAGDRQHAAQSHRPDLRARGSGRARRAARARLEPDRPPHLPAVGRALPAPALRRSRLRQPGGRLSVDARSRTATARSCSRRASGSAIWRFRR